MLAADKICAGFCLYLCQLYAGQCKATGTNAQKLPNRFRIRNWKTRARRDYGNRVFSLRCRSHSTCFAVVARVTAIVSEFFACVADAAASVAFATATADCAAAVSADTTIPVAASLMPGITPELSSPTIVLIWFIDVRTPASKVACGNLRVGHAETGVKVGTDINHLPLRLGLVYLQIVAVHSARCKRFANPQSIRTQSKRCTHRRDYHLSRHKALTVGM